MTNNSPLLPHNEDSTEFQALATPTASPSPAANPVAGGLDPGLRSARRKLRIACGLACGFMVAEIIGGVISGSLAIATDAAHLLSDVVGFCISLASIWIQQRPASASLSYGFHRAEVIGAICSVLLIWVLTAVLVKAAIQRFHDCLQPNAPEHVNGKIMFIIACIGLVVNIVLLWQLGADGAEGSVVEPTKTQEGTEDGGSGDCESQMPGSVEDVVEEDELKKGKDKKKTFENLNVRAAYLHALGDLIQSGGVIIAGAMIWAQPKWQIADPCVTFLFSILVLATTSGIIRSSVHILMEGTPEGIVPNEIEEGLLRCRSVLSLHDLHIWSLRVGVPCLSVHLMSNEKDVALAAAQEFLLGKGITNATIQVECPTAQYPI